MASLVQFLAAGVNGAENGSATFVLRATASSAASVLYSDFEETAQPGTNIITLDSHGAAEIYCDAYCDITLKTSAGATLRTVTIGHAATMVEVQSDSFTGTSYTGSPTASGQPITLAAILDKWDNSAGADDWKVSVGGVATNLSDGFAALAGLFFNVKSPVYGAVGDGTTDDTTAIGLAITAAVAAGGGIVFFPPTTSFYKFTTLTLSSGNITLMGAGRGASTLKSASTSAVITVSATTTVKLVDLSINGSGANANPLLQINAGAKLYVSNCDFAGSAYTGSLIRKTSGSTKTSICFEFCEFTPGSSVINTILNSADDGKVSFVVSKSTITLPSGYSGYAFIGPDFIVNDCVVDGSAVTGATFAVHVNPTSNNTAGKYLGQFTNNKFIDGGSATVCFLLTSIATGSDFTEANNTFSGFTAPTALTSADKIYSVSHNSQDAYRIFLGSRKGRTLEITHASTGTIVPLAFASYENVFVDYTAAGDITIQTPISVMVNGSECNMVIQNNNASTRTFTIDCGESVQTYGSVKGADSSGVNGSNSDVSSSVNNTERFIFNLKFMHFGSGAPLAFLSGVSRD